MAGTGEKFCLRWNDFENNISCAFREIRDEKDLFDCTLSCGAKQLQAHKLILSACSPFFREVFKQNPHSHPLLYLKGIGFDDLKACLNFMYHGEVNVAQDDLNTFLVVAEELKIKGLTQNNGEKEDIKKDISPHPSSQSRQLPVPPRAESLPPKRPRTIQPSAPLVQSAVDDDIVEVEPVVKTEPPHDMAVAAMAEEAYEESYDYGEYNPETVEYEGGLMEQGDSGKDAFGDLMEKNLDTSVFPPQEKFQCRACGKQFNDRSNCRRHVKSAHFEEEQVSCSLCGKFYKNKRSAKTHYQYCLKVNKHPPS